jgi:hypothetical protein
MSDETKKIKSDAMVNVRSKKMEEVKKRNTLKDNQMAAAEEELYRKVNKNFELEKKKREKEIYNKLVKDELNNKQKYYDEESEESEEEELQIIKKNI